MSPRKKFQLAITAVFGLIAFGSVGFKILLGLPWFDCLYFTLITITTIGFGEPSNMTEEARYFTVLLIIMGVSTIGYAFSYAAQAVVESELISTFGKRKMFKDINQLSGHYIMCGAGRIGSRVIREVARRGEEFVVIESDEGIADKLLSKGYLVLIGDATNEDVLLAAGIERARGLVCALSTDPDNLYLTLMARDLNKEMMLVARANEESAVTRLLKAGANKVVSPTITGSNQMAQMLLRPAVAAFMELASMTEQLELEMEQIEIKAGSPFTGVALKDTTIRSDLNVMVIAIKRAGGDMLFNPSAAAIIKENDALVVIGSHNSLVELEKMANPKKSNLRPHRH